jgi:penicillin-binding protein 1A
MDPKNGAVKAYVGGTNFIHFNYDMCMEGKRQVGSTIKPFLYSLAMENGFSPCDSVPNIQQTYVVGDKPWTPRNGSKARYGELVSLKWGLAQSNNWISAYLMNKLNPEAFVSLLNEYGIRNPEIVPSMSLCLGPCDISVGEMVSAYTAFVNHGIRSAPLFVTRIEDADGSVITHFQPIMNEVISDESANKMITMLKGVVDGGTGSRLRFRYNLKCEMGGKTGTTNNNSDAWFMGITPSLVSGVWVGGDDRDIHFDTMQMGQGATMALPIFALYMKKVFADKTLGYNEEAIFDIPEGQEVICPVCGEGEIVERTSGRGRSKGALFYACDRYPKCRTTYSGIPNGEKCEICGGPMINIENGTRCGNEKCKTVVALKKALLTKEKEDQK